MNTALAPIEQHAEFQELSPAIHILPAAPRFQFGTMPAQLAAVFYGRTHLPPAGIYCATDIEVSDGLLLRTSPAGGGKLIVAPALNWQAVHVEQAMARHGIPASDRPARRLPGRSALIVTPGYPIFGHWLADILPRLGLLDAAGYDLDQLTYIVAGDTPGFGLELLRLLGIGPERLVKLDGQGAWHPQELLLPTFPHNGRQFTSLLPHAARLMRTRVEARFGRLSSGGYPRSLLLSRHGWGARRMANREAFEAAAAAHGFHVVSPETLSMIDQLRLFANAREIIGEYGSAMHTTLFSQQGTMICALRGTQPHPAFIQSGIGDALGQPTGYVFGCSSEDPEKRGFSVDLADLHTCLETVFGEHRPSLGAAESQPEPVMTQPAEPSAAAPTAPPAHPPPPAVAPAQPPHIVTPPTPDPAPIAVPMADPLLGKSPKEAWLIGCDLIATKPDYPGLAKRLRDIASELGKRPQAMRFAIMAIDHDRQAAGPRAALEALLPAPSRPASSPAGTIGEVVIDFSAEGNAAAFLGGGWSRQEPRITWMLDEESKLTLPPLSVSHDWQCTLDASPVTQACNLAVFFNGHELARLIVTRTTKIEFFIPRELVANAKTALLTFEHPDCISPLELGRNRDPRCLAFATRMLRAVPDTPATS